jgi:hypothetical protein
MKLRMTNEQTSRRRAAWPSLGGFALLVLVGLTLTARDPGEWYLERKTEILTYIPLPGEEIEKSEAIAPKLERLMVISGEVQARQWVDHVIFRGLTFQHTNWNAPERGYSSPQAEAPLPGAFPHDQA